jgi:predicted methyltransferase
MPIILSHYQTKPLLEQVQRGIYRSLPLSLDLGLTLSEVQPDRDGVTFPDGQCLGWEVLSSIQDSEAGCFAVENNGISKIQVFSENSNQLFSLMATQGAPTMLISGIPMHRIQGVDPYQDTLLKVKTIHPVKGKILDTATGLGYTAIQAAKTARQVITIEINPAALAIARQNPWSRDLFNNPRISLVNGDSGELIAGFPDQAFSRIIHDPPTFSLAGDLYSGEFYRQLWRVLRPGGRLFHYTGDISSKSGGSTAAGAARRLVAAGFRQVTRKPQAFGLVAYK